MNSDRSLAANSQMRVTVELRGKSPLHVEYPLLPGDIIAPEIDWDDDGNEIATGTWMKHAPGLAIGGFVLTDEDVATLEAAPGARWEIA